MAYLLRVPGQPDAYPYSFADLCRDNPNCTFSTSLSAEDLAKFNAYEVTSTPFPTYNPRTERLIEGFEETTEGFKQTWAVRPATKEEIYGYDDLYPLTADWSGFRTTVLTNPTIDAFITAATAQRQLLAISFVTTLQGTMQGEFAKVWEEICFLDPEQAEPICILLVELAEQHSMPLRFVETLNPFQQ